jgi:hypothetical protein
MDVPLAFQVLFRLFDERRLVIHEQYRDHDLPKLRYHLF